MQDEGSCFGGACQENLVKSPRPHAPTSPEEFLRTPRLGPLHTLQIHFFHKPFGTRAGFEFIPSRQNSHLPVPFTRAEASLIGMEFACPWLKTLLFSFTNQHGHFTHVYDCSKAQHMKLPPPHLTIGMLSFPCSQTREIMPL